MYRVVILNLFMFGNLYSGFLLIGYVFLGYYKLVVILVFIGMMLDSFDGCVVCLLCVDL